MKQLYLIPILCCICTTLILSKHSHADVDIKGRTIISLGLNTAWHSGKIQVANHSTKDKKLTPYTGLYVGLGYNIYFDFNIVNIFAGFDVRGNIPFENNDFFEKNHISAKVREMGVTHVKIGLKFDHPNMQPYFIIGINVAKASYHINNILEIKNMVGFGASTGFGVEWMFKTNIGVRAEYRHTINNFKFNTSDTTNTLDVKLQTNINTISVGLIGFL